MPISPATAGGTTYQVTGSKGLVASLQLPLTATGTSREVELTYPAAPAGMDVRLIRGSTSLALLPAAAQPGGFTDTTTFPTRQIDASTAPGTGGTVTLTITVTAAAAPATETWELRVKAPAGASFRVTTGGTIPRIMCDPADGFTISQQPGFAADHAVEQSQVTFTAPAPSTTAAPTAVGMPAPPFFYRWTCTGPVAVGGFPACGSSPTLTVTLPAVAANQAVTVTADVWYEGGCPSDVGWLTTATSKTLTIEPRPTVQIAVHSTVGVDTWVRT